LEDKRDSFNSATDHQKNIIGTTTKKVNIRSLPKFIRIFYYFILSFLFVAFIFVLYTILK
jgi:hypothetical protein